MKYSKLDLGEIEAIVNKLGGMEGVNRFLSDEAVIQTIEPSLKIWKTIKLGVGHKNIDGIIEALRQRKVDNIDYILSENFKITSQMMEVDLVKISGAELGFQHCGEVRDIHSRAYKLGLQLCPTDVAAQVMLQATEEEINTECWGVVASERVRSGYRNSGGSSTFWCLGFGFGNPMRFDRRLILHDVGHGYRQEGHVNWVFMKPRK